MARKFLRWCYFLLLVALYPVEVFYAQDLLLSFMLASFGLGAVIYRKLIETGQRRWLLPSGFALALFLIGLHFTTNILFFPHSPRAPHYFGDACLIGPVYAFGSLFFGAGINFINQTGNVPPKTLP